MPNENEDYIERAAAEAEDVDEGAERIDAGKGETDPDAHRYAEFEDLRDMIEALTGKIDALMQSVRDGFGEFASVAVDSGAVIREDTEPRGFASEDEAGAFVPIDELVFFNDED